MSVSQTTVPTIPDHHKPPVPEMVRRAAAAAEAAFAATQQPPDGSDAKPEGEGASQPSPEPVAAPPTTPGSPAQGEPPPAPPAPATPEAPVDWQHRFHSLKGKHDQVLAQMGGLQGEVDNLHRLLATMQAAQPAPATTPVVTPQPGASDFQFAPITDEERADYGEELISLAERAAAAKFVPLIQNLQAKVAQLEQGVQGVSTSVAQDARSKALEHLQSEVPDWQALDTDVDFLAWLKEMDPFSGERRQVLLDRALAANNGPRIAYFFKAFKELQAPPALPPPANPQPRARTSLETLAAPGRGRPGTAPSAPATGGNQPSFSQSQITRFYEDVRRGMFRTNPAEKARIEQEIFAATAAGRIYAG